MRVSYRYGGIVMGKGGETGRVRGGRQGGEGGMYIQARIEACRKGDRILAETDREAGRGGGGLV